MVTPDGDTRGTCSPRLYLRQIVEHAVRRCRSLGKLNRRPLPAARGRSARNFSTSVKSVVQLCSVYVKPGCLPELPSHELHEAHDV